MSRQGKVECPICCDKFNVSVINAHVSHCLDKQETDKSKCIKSSPNSSSDQSSPSSKRQKLEHSDQKCDKLGDTVTDNRTYISNDLMKCPETKITNKLSSGATVSKNPIASIFCPKGDKTKGAASSSATCNAEHNNNIAEEKSRPFAVFSKGATQTQSPKKEHIPLADLMRPSSLEDYIGQNHVVGMGKILRKLMESSHLPSVILWGPPGCGKTTLARLFAKNGKELNNSKFVQLSATTSGISEVKEVVKVAKNELQFHKRKTILFIDEIHRFNKLQQDTFLPHVENGTLTLIGATTENPSFQVNNALLSRCRVIVLEKLSVDDIKAIVLRAIKHLGIMCIDKNQCVNSKGVYIEEDAINTVAAFCDGDARSALNALEIVYNSKRGSDSCVISIPDIKEALQRTHVLYDRAGDEHYHCASALQKSIRGSDDNGAIYWMTRMWEGGEDPLFIARRLLVTASEDIGLADPQALLIATATFQACQFLGRPECVINLAHCTTYLARAPKSNESFAAFQAAQRSIQEQEGPLPGVPLHLRNPSTKLMKQLGYGKGYNRMSQDNMSYLPQELCSKDFFNRRTHKQTT